MEFVAAAIVAPMLLGPIFLALFDVGRSPDAAWEAAGHTKVAWMGALMLPIPLVQWTATALYLTRVRPAVHRHSAADRTVRGSSAG